MKKQKCLFVLLLFALVSPVMMSFLTPHVGAAETIEDKGMNIIKNAMGLDITKCSISAISDQVDARSLYRGVVEQRSVRYNRP